MVEQTPNKNKHRNLMPEKKNSPTAPARQELDLEAFDDEVCIKTTQSHVNITDTVEHLLQDPPTN